MIDEVVSGNRNSWVEGTVDEAGNEARGAEMSVAQKSKASSIPYEVSL